MQYKITEIVETVGWSTGVNDAPPSFVTKAKELADKGDPVWFGTVGVGDDRRWILLGINPVTQDLMIVYRG
jgi:hypothetical protein